MLRMQYVVQTYNILVLHLRSNLTEKSSFIGRFVDYSAEIYFMEPRCMARHTEGLMHARWLASGQRNKNIVVPNRYVVFIASAPFSSTARMHTSCPINLVEIGNRINPPTGAVRLPTELEDEGCRLWVEPLSEAAEMVDRWVNERRRWRWRRVYGECANFVINSGDRLFRAATSTPPLLVAAPLSAKTPLVSLDQFLNRLRRLSARCCANVHLLFLLSRNNAKRCEYFRARR